MPVFPLIFFLLFLSFQGFAQTDAPAELVPFNQKRVQITQRGMFVLGGGGLASVVSGGIALSTGSTGQLRYFSQMQVMWGSVNVGIAALGYWQNRKQPSQLSPFSSLQSQYHTEKVLLVNTGIDLAYMAAGWALMERSQRADQNSDQLMGFGRSILLQGGFLFLYDLILHQAHVSNRKKFHPTFQKISLASNGIGLRFNL
jgi:hypothetical protein